MKVPMPAQNQRLPSHTLTLAWRALLHQPGPRLIVALIAASACARLWLVANGAAPVTWLDAALVVATGAWWPLQEWSAHRWVLHMRPIQIRGRAWLPYFAQTHRAHHQDPDHWPHILLPVRVVAGAYLTIASAASVLLPNFAAVATLMTAFSTAALLYEWTHFLTHTDYRAVGPYFKRIYRNHQLHHFKHEQNWFAFTVPHLDTWLGTDPEVRGLETSPTVKTLE